MSPWGWWGRSSHGEDSDSVNLGESNITFVTLVTLWVIVEPLGVVGQIIPW
jgi:acyl-CoA reductase-like NAD-dependent aldehyde dehydrogenase